MVVVYRFVFIWRVVRGWVRLIILWRCFVEVFDFVDDIYLFVYVEVLLLFLCWFMFFLVYFCEGKGEEMGFCLRKMRGFILDFLVE